MLRKIHVKLKVSKISNANSLLSVKKFPMNIPIKFNPFNLTTNIVRWPVNPEGDKRPNS